MCRRSLISVAGEVIVRVIGGKLNPMLIYHIVLPDVWAAFDTGLYTHSSLAAEGFIHCSFEHQVDAVIGRYYQR